MKEVKRCAKLIIVLSLLLPFSSMTHNLFSYTVFYIPLDVQFYVPPTPESIEKSGVKIADLSARELDKLFRAVDGDPGKPDKNQQYKLIRTKIIRKSDQKALYITSEKIVLSISEGKTYEIDERIIEAGLDVIVKTAKATGTSRFQHTSLLKNRGRCTPH